MTNYIQGGQLLHLDVLQAQIGWLMEQPAGAKLNHSLTYAIGSVVLLVLDLWNGTQSNPDTKQH